ncbi:MAG: T9SS type A sorting domain-containing protein [candidate division KSB1 bacterium]|nr:T9SS type A sorting domain-containing protein [candidate division KSB1 bacterium]
MKLKTIHQSTHQFFGWLLLPFSLILFGMVSNSLCVEVRGTVSTATEPVQNALVTFTDCLDTTRQFWAVTNHIGQYSVSIPTSVHSTEIPPVEFELEQNYPNPFSSVTMISYRLSAPSEVQITIFDILGREVKKFDLGTQLRGGHQLLWDGMTRNGVKVTSGIYFCRLRACGKTQVRKMIFSSEEGDRTPMGMPKPMSTMMFQLNHATIGMQTDYAVRISNTDSTMPRIVPKQIRSVSIQPNAVLNFLVEEDINASAAVIYLDSTRQHISGFGAANILRWRPDMTADQIEKAFGTNDGQIGLTILRLRIPPSSSEFGYNVPTAKAAYSRGVKIIASPWSPPASMKTNNNLVGGRLRESAYADYAAHLKSFADFMANNGAPLYAVSIQNEPDVQVTYESCDWNADELLKFVKENAPAVGANIIVPESFNFNHSLSDPILLDSVAASHVAIIGGHIYGGGLSSYPLAENKGKEIWMTEHLDTDTSWAKVLATGKEINDCMFTGMSAYIWWYIVRFYGPIKEDGNVSKRGFVMSQFARFVRPGYFRVLATQRPQIQVYVTAYRGDSRVVIVATNLRSTPVDQEFVLKNMSVAVFAPYVTSVTDNTARKADIVARAGRFTATLEASSVTTFVSQ